MSGFRFSFGCLVTVTCGLALSTTACSGAPADEDAAPKAMTTMAQTGSDELELRVAGRYVPDWLLRLTRHGSTFSGHAVLHLEGGGTSDAEPGNVTGTIAEDGTVTLAIEPPAAPRPLPATTFVGRADARGFAGTIAFGGHDDAVELVALAPGALDDHGLPLLATTRHQATVPQSDGCAVDVVGAEFFALPDPQLERDLNARMRAAIDHAASFCAPGVELVSGGAEVTLLRPHVVSVSIIHRVLRGEEPALAAPPERHTYDLASGKELVLFGDVVAAGSENDVGYAIDEAVAGLRTDVMSSGEKKDLDAKLQTALQNGALGTRFGLTDDAIVFDAPDFVNPHITGVRVRYAALGAEFLLKSSL